MTTLEEHNKQRQTTWGRMMEAQKPHANGIDCPNCGEELWDTNPNIILTSLPPQVSVHCPACDYRGVRLA